MEKTGQVEYIYTYIIAAASTTAHEVMGEMMTKLRLREFVHGAEKVPSLTHLE